MITADGVLVEAEHKALHLATTGVVVLAVCASPFCVMAVVSLCHSLPSEPRGEQRQRRD